MAFSTGTSPIEETTLICIVPVLEAAVSISVSCVVIRSELGIIVLMRPIANALWAYVVSYGKYMHY